MDPGEFFGDRAPRNLAAAPALFAIDRRIGVCVSGHGEWLLDLRDPPRLCRGELHEADAVVSLSAATLAALLAAPDTARAHFAAGRLALRGALEAAVHLPALLALLGAPRPPSGLDALFGDGSAVSFLRDHWPDTWRVAHGALARLPDIAGIDALHDAGALLARWPGWVRLSDAAGGRRVSAAEAARRHAAGEHLAFADVERLLAPLQPALQRLRRELDLPINCYGRCHVYASPSGTGEVMHFDQNVNFVVQLRGEKHWRLAPNSQVVHPLERYTVADARLSPAMRAYASGALPSAMPPGASEVHLRPGSVLFVPRGLWHETRAGCDSLSLNFTFDQPTWLDVLGADQRQALAGDPAWRALASGAGAMDRHAARRAEAALSELLAALPGPAPRPGLDARVLLAALRPNHPIDLPFEPGAPHGAAVACLPGVVP